MFTFKTNSSKSNAKRFLVNTCKIDAAITETYLTQVDGQWGSYVDSDGKPVTLAATLAPAPKADEEEHDTAHAVGANVFASMINPTAPVAAPVSATIVRDGKKVVDDKPQNEAPRNEDRPIKNFVDGYSIQKDRPEQHGVKRPSEGTTCAAIWAYLDANRDTRAAALKTIAQAHGWDNVTMSCQFYTWRRFNGIHGRQPK
jgi:hypothetical protein